MNDFQACTITEAFRNAVTEEEYYGTTGDAADCIYWDGIRGSQKVVLRKAVTGTYDPLAGATITVYKGNGVAKGKEEDGTDVTLSNLTSRSDGVFWVGMMPYGTYYIQETAAPANHTSNTGKWFCLIIDEAGAWMSTQGYNTGNEANDKNYALNNAKGVVPGH